MVDHDCISACIEYTVRKTFLIFSSVLLVLDHELPEGDADKRLFG